MKRNVWLVAGIILISSLAGLALQAQPDEYLFVHFKEPGTQGIYFALSKDGLHYEELNDGQPWLAPSQHGEIMRDIFVTRGPDGVFRAVWTWGWRGNSLGVSQSNNLLDWEPQREIPIMAATPGIRNVWAPETVWDAKKQTWIVFWSSSPASEEQGNRIWSSETTDFRTFSPPAKFFDPGYEVIDATMFHGKGAEYLIYKDQTRDPLRYQVRVARGPSVEGPWSPLGGPITPSWSEGPSALKVDDTIIVFFDHYRPPHAEYQAVGTKDWIHWRSLEDEISLPAGAKHGSFLRVTAEQAAHLRSRHDRPAQPATPPPSPSTAPAPQP